MSNMQRRKTVDGEIAKIRRKLTDMRGHAFPVNWPWKADDDRYYTATMVYMQRQEGRSKHAICKMYKMTGAELDAALALAAEMEETYGPPRYRPENEASE